MGFDWVVSVFAVEDSTSVSIADETNGNAISVHRGLSTALSQSRECFIW
jgi:hypothetical protein